MCVPDVLGALAVWRLQTKKNVGLRNPRKKERKKMTRTSFAMPRGTWPRLAEVTAQGTGYVRATDPRIFSLLATVRSLGPFLTILEGRISLVASSVEAYKRQR